MSPPTQTQSRSLSRLQPGQLHSLYNADDTSLILSAGFEKRALQFLRLFRNDGLNARRVVVLDYPNTELNEPTRSELLSMAAQVSANVDCVSISETGLPPGIFAGLHKTPLIVDVTGMDRVVMFSVLHALDGERCPYTIAYTEAEWYYPLKKFYDGLKEGATTSDESFARYLAKERTQFAYSYDCSLEQPRQFCGSPEPGRPFMLLAFFAFKRSRLQVVLQELEVERKLFILSQPVRSDIGWRKECQKIANWDLIRKNEPNIKTLPTLYPWKVARFLQANTYDNQLFTKYNIVLAPLGSKMQTIGCYLFWSAHREISVVFSQPKKYFSDAYSVGHRDTFMIKHGHLADWQNSVVGASEE